MVMSSPEGYEFCRERKFVGKKQKIKRKEKEKVRERKEIK